jgi:hypothetical protein
MSFVIFFRSLPDVHEMNTCRVGHVCPSVRMIELENRRTVLDEIWCGRYAIGYYPKIIQFSTICNTNMADQQTYGVGSTLAPLAVRPYSDICL